MRFAWASSPRSTCRERCLFSFFLLPDRAYWETPKLQKSNPKEAARKPF